MLKKKNKELLEKKKRRGIPEKQGKEGQGIYQKKAQEGCGSLREENPKAFPKDPIFQQPFEISLPENGQGKHSSADCKKGRRKGATSKNVKNRQKVSKVFRQFSRRAKNVKNRQEVSKIFSTLFDNFRAAPFSDPFWGALNSVLPENR